MVVAVTVLLRRQGLKFALMVEMGSGVSRVPTGVAPSFCILNCKRLDLAEKLRTKPKRNQDPQLSHTISCSCTVPSNEAIQSLTPSGPASRPCFRGSGDEVTAEQEQAAKGAQVSEVLGLGFRAHGF